uniref:RRM domain-containing protein n=1 Tax=Panagrolaimus sp. JU765 TaxID=591449 RepID=A0AC34QRN6_9BILA
MAARYEGKVYVGGLPDDARTEEVEDCFKKFGRVRKTWVARRPPGFAFVEFEDVRDAADAVRALNGAKICGARVRVELSHGKSRHSSGGRSRGNYGRQSSPMGRRSPRRSSPYRERSRSPRRSRSRSPVSDRKRRRSFSRSVSPDQRGSRSPRRSRSRTPE